MNKRRFLHVLDELLELDPGTVKAQDELATLGSWDSLAILGFIALADQSFSITVSPSDISQAKTVNDLIKLLGANITED